MSKRQDRSRSTSLASFLKKPTGEPDWVILGQRALQEYQPGDPVSSQLLLQALSDHPLRQLPRNKQSHAKRALDNLSDSLRPFNSLNVQAANKVAAYLHEAVQIGKSQHERFVAWWLAEQKKNPTAGTTKKGFRTHKKVKNPYSIHFDDTWRFDHPASVAVPSEPKFSDAAAVQFLKEDIGLDHRDAKKAAEQMAAFEQGETYLDAPRILRWISNKGDGTHGVEMIYEEEDGTLSSRHGDDAAFFINTGDTYSPTVLYDVTEDKFYLTTYGDWVEKFEKEQLERLLDRPEVYLDNLDQEDGFVMVALKGPHARKLASHTQSISGSMWECVDDNFCYAIITDYPDLVADLESGEDGPQWRVNEDEYMPPDEY